MNKEKRLKLRTVLLGVIGAWDDNTTARQLAEVVLEILDGGNGTWATIDAMGAQLAENNQRHVSTVNSITERLRALEGTEAGSSSPARTSVVALLALAKDALVRITALEGGGELREDLRALSGRVQAIGVRIDQLEAGRTGRIVGERLVGHTMQRHGDPTTAALEGVRAELDAQRRRNTDLEDRTRRLLERADATQRELEAERALVTRTKDELARRRDDYGKMAEEAIAPFVKQRDAARAALDEKIRERQTAIEQREAMSRDRALEVERADRMMRERDEARRGYKCAVDERDSLEKQRDEVVRQRDQYAARNKAHSATTADQAAQIAELRAANRSITELLEGLCMDCGGIGLQGAKDSAKVVRDHIKITTEALRVADGDRVPLRMDLDIARSDLKLAKESLGRALPFVAVAQRTAQSFHEEPDPNLRELSSPLHKVLCELADAAETYEEACAQAADAEDDDGFANAAANEGARIAAESRAEAESDPGT